MPTTNQLAVRVLPTRLIDVGTWNDPEVRLVEGSYLPKDTQYSALSHCWGAKGPMKLTKATLSQFGSGIRISDLPRTFQDAIEVTRAIGLSALWIDALCIIQDSEKDWLRESAVMGKVYKYCALNISATASSDGDGGLKRSRSEAFSGSTFIHDLSWFRLLNVATESITNSEVRFICCKSGSWRGALEDSPLKNRGWVVQEQMLSPRVVHFSEGQVFWDCPFLRASECFPEYSRSRETLMTANPFQSGVQNTVALRNRLSTWYKIVYQYSRTELTFEEDKLIAVGGIAAQLLELWNLRGREYLAGLWHHSALALELLWTVSDTTKAKRPKKYRAPSWSWASLDAPIINPWVEAYRGDAIDQHQDILITVKEANVSPVHSFVGPIRGGYLRIQGPLCKVSLSDNDSPIVVKLQTGKEYSDVEVHFDTDYSIPKENITFMGVLELGMSSSAVKSVVGLLLTDDVGVKQTGRCRYGVLKINNVSALELFRKGDQTFEFI